MTSLDQVRSELQLVVRSKVACTAIVTRLILRTGININEPRDNQRHDPECIARVVAELQRMGISLERVKETSE